MVLFRSRRRRSRWSSRQPSRYRWLIALLIIVGAPVGIELLSRLITNWTGFNEQVQEDSSLKRIHGYQLQFVNADGQSYQESAAKGELLIVRSPLLGYQFLPNQKNSYWSINQQGFRDEETTPIEKPEGEIRIFLLGGSTAFGQLSSNNEITLAHQLETRLNQRVAQQRANPDKFQPEVLPYWADKVREALALPPRIRDGQYRVINAAVPGYASGNELAQLIKRVVNYDPDIVVVLNGYADLLLPSSQLGADVPGLEALLENETPGIGSQISEQIQSWFNHLSAVQVYKHYTEGSQATQTTLAAPLNLASVEADDSLNDSLGADEAELKQRILRYRNHMRQMARWASSTQKRLVIGLQPEITGRNADNMTSAESEIVEDLGDTYQQWMQAGYGQLSVAANQVAQSSANVSMLNLYQMYSTFEGHAFQSPTSLTDEANQELAEQFYRAIATELTLQPANFTGRRPPR